MVWEGTGNLRSVRLMKDKKVTRSETGRSSGPASEKGDGPYEKERREKIGSFRVEL